MIKSNNITDKHLNKPKLGFVLESFPFSFPKELIFQIYCSISNVSTWSVACRFYRSQTKLSLEMTGQGGVRCVGLLG